MQTRTPLSYQATETEKRNYYQQVQESIVSLISYEDDLIAGLATTACELHHSFGYFDWTGFYRPIGKDSLVIGPYQGTHGCLRIPIGKGVCGEVAEQLKPQRVDDVNKHSNHIACSSSTQSEIVLPLQDPAGKLLAVLDVDSDQLAAFSEADEAGLLSICQLLGQHFAPRYS